MSHRRVPMPARSRWVILAGLLVVGALSAPVASAKPPAGSPAEENATTTSIQLLALNDFHGQLEAGNPTASSGFRIGNLTAGVCSLPGCVPAGGVEYLATHVAALEATNPNTLVVSAGDNIGATPLLSALFHDEPTIEAMNEVGLKKLEQPDFTASTRLGSPALVVTSEQVIPEAYWVPQSPRLDRQGLTADLKRGKDIPGACLGNANPILVVRTK